MNNNDIHCKTCGQANWLPSVAEKQQEYIARIEQGLLKADKGLEVYEPKSGHWERDESQLRTTFSVMNNCDLVKDSVRTINHAGKTARQTRQEIKDLIKEIETREAIDGSVHKNSHE